MVNCGSEFETGHVKKLEMFWQVVLLLIASKILMP